MKIIQLVIAILLLCITRSTASLDSRTKSAVFLSPRFELEPGSVLNKFYHDIDFPRGHIGIKSFDAEVVDESGKPVPLHETYLHHWVAEPYHDKANGNSNISLIRNSGVCQHDTLRQYFGLGSETRRTATRLPDPYAFEAGKSEDEKWVLNIHAIDTRGVDDRLGCTECRCDLYNATVDEHGRVLRPGYKGGLLCCYDQTRCKLGETGLNLMSNNNGGKRGLFLKYTVTWVDWSHSVLPATIYIVDVTDESDHLENHGHHICHVEYTVPKSCDASNSCIDTRRNRVMIPKGGHVIYAVAHQHTGGIGSTLRGEDGRVLCESNAKYGKGKEAGNEEGYIVGMSVCYPEPGSVQILDGETLIHESRYESSRTHTGVMALFYVVVADRLPNPNPLSSLTRTMWLANRFTRFL